MFLDKIKRSVLKDRPQRESLSVLRRLPAYLSNLKQLTWVNELKTVLNLVARRQTAP